MEKKWRIGGLVALGIAAAAGAAVATALTLMKKQNTEDEITKAAPEEDTEDDAILVDLDGDGEVDAMLEDLSGDGNVDTVTVDTTGVPFDEDVYKRMHRLTAEKAISYLKRELSLKDPESVIRERIFASLEVFYREKTRIVPGVPELLEALDRAGVVMAAATSNRREFAAAALRFHGIDRYFSRIVTCDDFGTTKSEPTVYLKAAELIGSSPSETVVFEDSPHAADTARKAGFQVELVSGDLSDGGVRSAILRRAGVGS